MAEAESRGAMVIIGASSKKTYASKSCFCLTTNSSLRRVFIDFIEWPWFDRFILLLIVVNCTTLAIQGPPGNKDAPIGPENAARMELLFTILFTIEMLSKWIAMGVGFHKSSYVRDWWNLLDMTVVFAGWAPLISIALGLGDLENVSAIRSVRALRPLRSVQRLPGLRRQVVTMIDSLPKMADVALLGSFILLVYGVLGVQLFKGTLLYRCYPMPDDPEEAIVCTPPEEAELGGEEVRGGPGRARRYPGWRVCVCVLGRGGWR